MNSVLNRAAFQNLIILNRYSKLMVAGRIFRKVVIVSSALSILTGCTVQDAFSQSPLSGEGLSADASSSSKLIERDIEAPEVFQLTGSGLWDGRPSLGGVWVAHTSAQSAERVIIRNGESGKFVIGALFRSDSVKEGLRFQMSADTAQALGVLASQPVNLDVTALRPQDATANDKTVRKIPQNDVIATATAALEEIEETKSAVGISKPFIQLGIFNVEKNAKNTATTMRQVGIVPLIKQQSKGGKPFWRVLIGPANSLQERALLLKTVKSVGFQDAYAVSH